MFGLLRVLGLAVLVALILLVGDTAACKGAWWPQPLLASLAVTVVVRLTRVLTLMSHLLKARVTP